MVSEVVDVIVESDENWAPTPLFNTAATDGEVAVPVSAPVIVNDTDPGGDDLTAAEA